jgi:hypothetical protein
LASGIIDRIQTRHCIGSVGTKKEWTISTLTSEDDRVGLLRERIDNPLQTIRKEFVSRHAFTHGSREEEEEHVEP